MVGRVGSGLVVESFDFLWVAGRLHVNHLSINYGGGPYQRPSLISNSTPESLPIHPRTNSRHSAKPHPAPAGRRRRSAGCGSPDHREAQDKASLLLDPLSVLFPIKRIQPPASDQIQTIAEKTFKPGLGSPIYQCHGKLFGW